MFDRPPPALMSFRRSKQMGLSMLREMSMHMTCPSLRRGTVSYFSLLVPFRTLCFILPVTCLYTYLHSS
jgi:hypothetical protein